MLCLPQAITLYLLWAKTEPGALQGRCERIKASAKVVSEWSIMRERDEGRAMHAYIPLSTT